MKEGLEDFIGGRKEKMEKNRLRKGRRKNT